MITCKTDIYDHDDIALKKPIKSSELYNSGENIKCNNLDEYLFYAKVRCYFLSNTIFKTSVLIKFHINSSNAYPHTEVLIRIAKELPTLVVDKVLVKQRSSGHWNVGDFEVCLKVSIDTLGVLKQAIYRDNLKNYFQFYYAIQVLNGLLKKSSFSRLTKTQKKKVVLAYFENDYFIYKYNRIYAQLLLKLNFNLGVRYLRLISKSLGCYGTGTKINNPLCILSISIWKFLDLFNVSRKRYLIKCTKEIKMT